MVELVKGGPDVVLARCSHAGGPFSGAQVPIARRSADIEAANRRMGEDGLRVLAFAVRLVADDELETMVGDPMALTHDLAFVGMVGMIDPLRAEAKDAVATALGAGIDVRMITGDNPITARAIGAMLGLGPGAISGSEFQAMPDEEVVAPVARAARLRPRLPRGQAAPGAADAAAGPDRRGHRRRGQRRRRPQAGGHRGRDGQRERGDQAGRQDDPHRRQLRHAGPRRRARAQGLRQDRLLRPLPDDPAAGAGPAVHRRHARSTSTTAWR